MHLNNFVPCGQNRISPLSSFCIPSSLGFSYTEDLVETNALVRTDPPEP